MNAKTLIPLVIVGGAIAYAAKAAADKKAAIKTLKLQNPHISNFSAQLLTLSFDLSFDLVNPSNTSLSFDQISGQVEYGGKALGRFTIPTSSVKTLAANKVTPVSFRVSISNASMGLSLVKLISDLVKGKAKDIDPFLYVTSLRIVTNGVGLSLPAITYDLRTQSIAGIGKGGFFKRFRQIITPPHMRIMQAVHKKIKNKRRRKKARRHSAPASSQASQASQAQRYGGFRRRRRILTPEEQEARRLRRLRRLEALKNTAPGLQQYFPQSQLPGAAPTVTAQNVQTVAPAAADTTATNYMPGVPVNGY